MLLFMLDEQAGGGDGGSALSYIETLLSLLPFGLAMSDSEVRFLFINDAFARAAGVKDYEKPSYPGDLVVRADQSAVADSIRRNAVGQQLSGIITVRHRTPPDDRVALSLAGFRGLGEGVVFFCL